MSDDFATMIIPANLVPLARTLAGAVSQGGVGMFTSGLSPTGTAPATHFVSTGYIGEKFVPLLTDAVALFGMCQDAGASVTQAQCNALVAGADVSEDQPFVAFERLNLKLVQETET